MKECPCHFMTYGLNHHAKCDKTIPINDGQRYDITIQMALVTGHVMNSCLSYSFENFLTLKVIMKGNPHIVTHRRNIFAQNGAWECYPTSTHWIMWNVSKTFFIRQVLSTNLWYISLACATYVKWLIFPRFLDHQPSN